MKKLFSLLTALLLFILKINAQQTGDFIIAFASNDTLLGNDSVRIHFHVPASYQPGAAAKLIVGLHGIGNPQTPEQIRNYLSETGDSIDAIIACPAPYLGNLLKTSVVINLTIDSVKAWYNMDTNSIYIAGYSAGSDMAAQYLLNEPAHRVKGLIWFAPGFFYEPNLSEQLSFPPTCLCFGSEDPVSNLLGQVTSIIDSFDNSPFQLFFNEIEGVDHTMEFAGFTKEMLECVRFINDPDNFVPDEPIASVNALNENKMFKVYPNPTNSKLIIDWESVEETAMFKLFDLTGNLLIHGTITPKQTIDLSNQQQGIYFIHLTTAKHSATTKIFIAH